LKFSTDGDYTLNRIEVKVTLTPDTAKKKDAKTSIASVNEVVKKMELNGKTTDTEGSTQLETASATSSGSADVMYYYFDDI
jgi:hypothetical protein